MSEVRVNAQEVLETRLDNRLVLQLQELQLVFLQQLWMEHVLIREHI